MLAAPAEMKSKGGMVRNDTHRYSHIKMAAVQNFSISVPVPAP